MRALSVRQPWAWAIFKAGKNIENRNWKDKFRDWKDDPETIAIHVASRKDDVENLPARVSRPQSEDLKTGVILGVVDVVDPATTKRNKWFCNQYKYHWELRNPRPLDHPIKCTGNWRLWEVKPEDVRKIDLQLTT